jgi:hypothetical protein
VHNLLWDWCITHSKLFVIAQVFIIKSNYGLSDVAYDRILEWEKNMLPGGNKLKNNFYTTKSIMKSFGLKYQKI